MEVKVAEYALYCLTIAGLSMFLQECYKKPMILRRYYNLIAITYLKSQRKWIKELMKPLGLCVYCQSFWINLAIYPLCFPINISAILSIGGVFISIELIRWMKK